MKSRLPHLPVARSQSSQTRSEEKNGRLNACLLALVVLVALGSIAERQNQLLAQQTASEPPAIQDEAPTSGDRLLQTVASHVGQYDSIQAKVRYKARLFEVDLVGSGAYYQQGRSDGASGARGLDYENPLRSRFELKTQTQAGANSLLEVNTGRYLYRQRRLGEQQSVDRVDLRRVRREWAARSAADSTLLDQRAPQQILAQGGLAKLLTSLGASFKFDEERPVRLGENMQAIEIVGHWRKKKLAQLLPGQSEKILAGEEPVWAETPNQIPHEVAISIGSDDLFPYVIEYRRFVPDNMGNEPTARKRKRKTSQAALLQFHQVATNRPIDASQFNFRSDNSVYVPDDRTEEFLPKRRARR